MYIIRRALTTPEMEGSWDGPAWRRADPITLSHARPEGSGHRPETRAKLLYGGEGIHGIFRVADRFVRCVHTGFMDPVYRDSCVEFFVRPCPEKGYLNFEFNCGGALLASYITDPRRTAQGVRRCVPLTQEDAMRVSVYHSLPRVVDPELSRPTDWLLEFFIPFSLISKYAGPLGSIAGATWQANFYKCGDATSHPHWLSWMPLPEHNFHLPECFGSMCFDAR